jgi:hypothetical protein
LKRRRRGRGGGPGVDTVWRAEMGRRGGPGHDVGQHDGAATAGSGPAVARASGAAWPHRAAGRTGEGRKG